MPHLLRRYLLGIGAFIGHRPWIWTLLITVAPFVRGSIEFCLSGVPEVLLSEDMATIELRTLMAAHHVQLLGPYSRFGWDHPGPSLFYLAVPLYELCGERGSALNLFALVVNLAASLGIVASAWRLRGELFALTVAAMLGVFAATAPRFSVSSAWNPSITVLPFTLLCFLCVRLALAELTLYPLIAFLASAIVQTHVGYVPSVSFLIGASGILALQTLSRDPLWRSKFKRSVPYFLATMAILSAMWALPFYETLRYPPGNLRVVWAFFQKQGGHAHDAPEVAALIARQLTLPATLGGLLPFSENGGAQLALALLLVAGLLCGTVIAFRRRWDAILRACLLALGLLATSWFAVRSITGTIHAYLVIWVAVVGLLVHTAVSALLLALVDADRRRGARAVLATVGIVLVGFASWQNDAPVIDPPDLALEKIARDVEAHLKRTHAVPIIDRGGAHIWEPAVALALHLYKHKVPFFADRRLIPFTGSYFASTEAATHILLLRRRSLSKRGCQPPHCERISSGNKLFVYLKAR